MKWKFKIKYLKIEKLLYYFIIFLININLI